MLLRILCLTAVFSVMSTSQARASNAKSEVVLEMQRVESRLKGTRWNLNTLSQKKQLQEELRMLRLLYDRITEYEGDLMAFPCAGSVIDGEGGPPSSSAGSDVAGLLNQSTITGGQIGAGRGATPPPTGGDSVGPGPAQGAGRGGFAFIRRITDVEVKLIAGLVIIDDRLDTHDWHWNNQAEKKQLMGEREMIVEALRRIRNSRC